MSLFRSDETETEDAPTLNSISDFLEYCALCSDQKELEEAEGGVSNHLRIQYLFSFSFASRFFRKL